MKTKRPKPRTIRAKVLEDAFRFSAPMSERALLLEEEIMRLDESFSRLPHLTYGAEIRLAGAFVNGALPVEGFKIAGRASPTINIPSPRRLFARPPVEPVAHFYQSHRELLHQDQKTIEDIASRLYGAPRTYRTKSVASRRDRRGIKTVYTPVESMASQLETRANRDVGVIGTRLGWAIHRLVDFMSIHPLEDGNGRVARCLFLLDLAEQLGLATPCIPLAPIYYLNADAMVYFIRRMYLLGNPDHVLAFYLDAVALAIKAAYAVLPSDHAALEAYLGRAAKHGFDSTLTGPIYSALPRGDR